MVPRRRPVHRPTTAGRSSSRRRGRTTSPPTSSSAAWPPGPSLLGAGADLTGRPGAAPDRPARRAGRASRCRWWPWCTTSGKPSAVPQHAAGGQADLADVGRHVDPHRRTARSPASPATAELVGRVGAPAGAAAPAGPAARGVGPPGRRSAPRLVAPAVASYTAVLLSDTATPSWHEAYRELPFVFVGSAAAAAGGLGMIGSPVRRGRPGAAAGRRRCAARAGGGAPDGAAHGHHRRAAAPGPGRHADAGEQGADGRPAPSAPHCSGAAAASLRRCPGPRCWPGRRAPGSRSSRPGRPRRATPSYTVVPQRERLDRRQGGGG